MTLISASKPLAAALTSGFNCANVSAVTNTSTTCDSGPLPNDSYYVLMQYNGSSQYTLMYVAHKVTAVLTITGVSPPFGSIGGGTSLVIYGYGFRWGYGPKEVGNV